MDGVYFPYLILSKACYFFWPVWLFSKSAKNIISFSTFIKRVRRFLNCCSYFKPLSTSFPETDNVFWTLVINICSNRNVIGIIQMYALKRFVSLGMSHMKQQHTTTSVRRVFTRFSFPMQWVVTGMKSLATTTTE